MQQQKQNFDILIKNVIILKNLHFSNAFNLLLMKIISRIRTELNEVSLMSE